MAKFTQLLKSKRFWAALATLTAGVLLILQVIPIEKSNPPVKAEPQWDSPETRALVKTACFDCHSNETTYPWYANIAPTRILVRDHVNEGRSNMNFSEWDNSVSLEDIEEVINEGEMPPWDYLLLHPNARLNDTEKAQLLTGLRQTLINSGASDNDNDNDDDDD